MKRILTFALVLCIALSASALADYQVTSAGRVDTELHYKATQYDNYIVYIPAEVYIEGGRIGNFSVELEVDERYDVPYSNIGVFVEYNDTYREWSDDIEGETFWNRGYFFNNNYGDGFIYWLYRNDTGNQVWAGNLEGTEYEGLRFDDESINVYDDMQRGYDSRVIFWLVGDDFSVDHYARTDLTIDCRMDLSQLDMAHPDYYGRITFGIWDRLIWDNNVMLDNYGKYWEKDEDDPTDESKWILRDNDGQYIKDEETREWKPAE